MRYNFRKLKLDKGTFITINLNFVEHYKAVSDKTLVKVVGNDRVYIFDIDIETFEKLFREERYK